MISLTIDVRDATVDQLKKFGEITGMQQALHELLYRSRGHEGTTITVLGGKGKSERDDFLSIVARPIQSQEPAATPVPAVDVCSQCGC